MARPQDAEHSWGALLLPWLYAYLVGLTLCLALIWPERACAQRDPQAEAQRRPGGAIQRAIPVPPAMCEGLSSEQGKPAPPPAYFREREDGWFWYRDPAKPSPPIPLPVEAPRPLPDERVTESDAEDPVKRIARQRERLERIQALAILEPTRQNVAAYLEQHQALMEQSERFADTWQQVVWTTPVLDNSLRAPTGSAAYVRADADAEGLDQRLTEAAQHYGLMFFFRGSCPYCHQFAPVLKAFSERYGFSVVAVTLDGGTLPTFPQPKTNDAAATALEVESVPAVYLIEPRQRTVAPASFGFIGYSELAQRVDTALQQIRSTPETQGLALNGAPP